MPSLVVCLDASPSSEAALKYALKAVVQETSKSASSLLHLISVAIPEPPDYLDDGMGAPFLGSLGAVEREAREKAAIEKASSITMDLLGRQDTTGVDICVQIPVVKASVGDVSSRRR
jgi:hypothetical protein